MSEEKKELIADHEHRGHAILSASSASRWLHCPPSVRLSDGIPDRGSDFASEGTKAHEMAEAYLNGLLQGKTDDEVRESLKKNAPSVAHSDAYAPDDNNSIIENVSLYVDYIIGEYNRLVAIDEDTVVLPEVRVSYDNVAREGFGTSDCVIIGAGEIIVIDLKYGKGVKVDALGNPQLRLYAIGALNEFMPLHGSFEKVKTAIIQPRLNHLSEEVMTPEELYSWGETTVKPMAERAYKGVGDYAEGEWCRFCKAKGCCPLQAAQNLSLEVDMENNPEVEALDENSIADILERGKGLIKWYKALETYATDKVLTGGTIPGYKLVESRSKKVWKDDEEAAEKLRKAGLTDDQIWTSSIVSPSKAFELAEKLDLSDDEIRELQDMTEKANINPVLVPVSDKREPLAQSVIDELMGSND